MNEKHMFELIRTFTETTAALRAAVEQRDKMIQELEASLKKLVLEKSGGPHAES